MSLMTYDLSDDLQMAVRMMGDGRLTLTEIGRASCRERV